MGGLPGSPQTPDSTGLPPELFRFGVQYADGRKATTVGNPFSADAEPQGPILLPGSGGGGAREWDQSYWLWPLPPAGPLAFVCEWPAHEVALTRAEIDTSLILEAAARAETLWDESPTQDERGWGRRILAPLRPRRRVTPTRSPSYPWRNVRSSPASQVRTART